MTGEDVFDELRRTGEHVAVFNEIAKALTSTLEPREVLRSIIDQVTHLVRPASWFLLLLDEKTGELCFELAFGEGAENRRSLRVSSADGIAGAAFTSGQAQVVANIIAIPLRAAGSTLGVLELINRVDAKMSRQDLQALKTVCDYAAIAIANARNFRRVQELTIIDDHTGLYNARHLRTMLDVEVQRALRFAHPLSLIFLDLDHFKAINDEHGHMIGTSLLQEIGRVLASSVRKVDSAFRYGGDEFAILLVETDAQGAVRVARRIQSRLEKSVFRIDGRLDLKTTASQGIATFPDDAASAAELLHAADQAMYRAKSRGRNAVVSAADGTL
jgi:diguanylate cyclase (GGDEF)-like protein